MASSAKDLQAARQRLADAEASYKQAAERVKAEERKADTRKKVILGGALLALMRESPEQFDKLRPVLGKNLGPRDRAWLEAVGLTFPVVAPKK